MLLLSGCGGAPAESAGTDSAISAQQARHLAEVTARTLSLVAAAARPAADLQAHLEQGLPFPQCPSLSYAIRGNVLDLRLAYDSGCGVDDAANVTLAGTLNGTYVPGVHEFELDATALTTAGGLPLHGRYSGKVTFRGELQVFAVLFDLASSDGRTVEGRGSIEIDRRDGSVRIAYASASIRTNRESFELSLTDAISRYVGQPPFAPASGQYLVRPTYNQGIGDGIITGQFD